jgi:succinate dehydrogenase / fumarate reductase cytochrome b subunit
VLGTGLEIHFERPLAREPHESDPRMTETNPNSDATEAVVSAALGEKQHFLIRKLHSLTGIVPLGAFFVEHMVTNALAWGEHGAEKYNEAVKFLRNVPFVLGIEVFGIFLPLLFHGVIGMWIAADARLTATNYPRARNWMYILQRVTGALAFVFIVFHLLHFRFRAHEQPFEAIAFQEVQALLGNAFWFVAYVVGVAATAFHLGNGIPLFCISWGITVSKHSQQRMNVVGAIVGVLLFALGTLSAFGFVAQR